MQNTFMGRRERRARTKSEHSAARKPTFKLKLLHIVFKGQPPFPETLEQRYLQHPMPRSNLIIRARTCRGGNVILSNLETSCYRIVSTPVWYLPLCGILSPREANIFIKIVCGLCCTSFVIAEGWEFDTKYKMFPQDVRVPIQE